MKTLAVLGTGLMGSSVGLACKQKHIFDSCIGFDSNAEQLHAAIQLGCFDREFSFGDSVDAICVAVPVSMIAPTVDRLAKIYTDDTPVFDVGSVKHQVVKTVDELPSNYVPCHPIAGSEKSGPSAARVNLFENAICVVSPLAKTDPKCVELVRQIWERLGTRVIEISPEEHDKTLGLTSHLPHLVSFAVVEMLSEQPSVVRKLVGNGMKDFTRIAGANGKVWGDIVSANAQFVGDHVETLIGKLHELLELARTQPETLEKRLDAISSFQNHLHGQKSPSHSN